MTLINTKTITKLALSVHVRPKTCASASCNLTRWPLGHRRRSAAHQNDGYNFIRTETDFQSSVQQWSLAVWVCSSRADCIWHAKIFDPPFRRRVVLGTSTGMSWKRRYFRYLIFFYLKIKIIGPRGLPRRGSFVAGSRRKARDRLAPSGAAGSQRQRWGGALRIFVRFL